MNRVPLHTLAPGRRFGIWSQEKQDIGKTGVVMSHSRGSTEVKYDGLRDTRFTDGITGEEIHFSSPNGSTNISPNTEVFPL